MRAMVNLAALGLGETAVWVDGAHPNLWLDLASVADSMDAPLRGLVIHPNPKVDWVGLGVGGVPSITLLSYGGRTAEEGGREPVPDDPRFDPERHFEAYRLVAAYLAYLDQSLLARIQSDPR